MRSQVKGKLRWSERETSEALKGQYKVSPPQTKFSRRRSWRSVRTLLAESQTHAK